ncbi:ABC transporter ATP-binding protein [Pseudaminobacter sp. 19-2017]|uniref:ABC transporter ATP-binding protein n=1 Tax=Pseudaminobacter soli (ex Zhang et al. 2022) TaxID=2831468 RepID=A0A942E2I2_9HYPH|nr:ATP-binding cassette domain-containing protein [Pseudaminobacter soli]MBS3649826.1 ABC transporter ATP-binding protein [Pseudaminobacter soli]
MDLAAEHVTVRFGGLVAIDDVSIAISPGEVLGLIGPNGAGKTTLVNVLAGFQAIARGSLRLGERSMAGSPASSFARSGIVRSFQSVRLFRGMTLSENVEVGFVSRGSGRQQARERALSLLKELNLHHKAHHPANALSYGEERRAGLARALALEPRFLLLDEPAAGLAAAEAEELRQTILALRDRYGCGILVIEHNMALVMSLCDRVHVIGSGKTIAIGTPEAVRADQAVRAAYLGGKELG